MNKEKLNSIYATKQLVLAKSLFDVEYKDCTRAQKNKINNIVKMELMKYISVPLIIPDGLFELRCSLKTFIRSNILTTKQLLQKDRLNYVWFIKNGFNKEYNYIFYTTYYMCENTPLHKRLYHIMNDMHGDAVCSNESSNNIVRYSGYSTGYSKFCCIRCSKNENEIKKINLFNGKNRGDIPIVMRSEKHKYWYMVRRLTDKNYKLYIKK